MTTSVLISTYNGSEFLKDQLDSILAQTVLPDEILIVDDCSSDNGMTKTIADEYASNNRIVKSISNPQNKGWARSFMEGCDFTSGDIVFFCDQDDIWLPNKIELMVPLFEDERVNIAVSACRNFKMKSEVSYSSAHEGKLIKDYYFFDKKFIYPKGVGAAMGLKRDFIDKYKNLWNNTIGHDRFFQVMAILFDTLYYYDAVLIYHRVHDHNATGSRSYNANRRVRDIEGNLQLLSQIKHLPLWDSVPQSRKKVIDQYVEFANARKLMLNERSKLKWIGMVKHDLGFYPTQKTWFGDFKCIQ